MFSGRTVIPGLGVAVVLALSACSPTTETAKPAQPPVAPLPAEPPAAPAAPRPTQLSALSSADIEGARLEGELGCSFSTSTASPVLVAMGDVASNKPSQGVVKTTAGLARVVGPAGGFDAMSKGGVFTSARLSLSLVVTGPATGGGESPPKPALLTLDGDGLVREELVGSWTCGP